MVAHYSTPRTLIWRMAAWSVWAQSVMSAARHTFKAITNLWLTERTRIHSALGTSQHICILRCLWKFHDWCVYPLVSRSGSRYNSLSVRHEEEGSSSDARRYISTPPVRRYIRLSPYNTSGIWLRWSWIRRLDRSNLYAVWCNIT